MNKIILDLLKVLGWCFMAFIGFICLFLFVSFIRGISGPSTPSIREKPYECGMLGHQQMRIDRRYLFLSKVEYQGVDYWGGNSTQAHEAKGCNDPISSANFRVSWPAMSPTGSFNYLEKPDDLSISIQQSQILTSEGGEKIIKKYIKEGMTRELKIKLRKSIIGSSEEMSEQEFKEKKQFNSNLGLYQIDVVEEEGSQKKVYWQETGDKKVTLVISCLYFKMGITMCELEKNNLLQDRNMRYLKLDFRSELLPHWQQLIQDSEKLIQSFTVKGK
ncbi:hypothetical protein [Acinetobacter boissieri]|uniref:Uncharacterized protein n=1 Tax=Acinetobacter boissieri TaxID=1219383 RepID=A0A1G6GSE3_9GAMM|nr:hypothetical protein [Acinetobacter boissieri]SDB84783.1 hypothetical protein SAMN05421733_102109 [Acinetobacter boissieri]